MIRVNFTGNLVKDADVRELDNGRQAINFRVATSKGIGENDKARSKFVSCESDDAYFVNVVVYTNTDSKLPQYLTKGKLVEVSAHELQLRRWSNGTKDGIEVSVSGSSVNLLGGNSRSDSKRSRGSERSRTSRKSERKSKRKPKKDRPERAASKSRDKRKKTRTEAKDSTSESESDELPW